jgi:ketosteroid isomerase-like protein
MSSDQIVRKRLPMRGRSSRALEQRVVVRFPRLADLSLRLVGKLPPTSRVRQALVWRGFRLSVEAFNRRDFDALSPTRHPDFEFYPPREAVEAGFFDPCYRGDAGYRKYVSELSDVWGADMRVESVEFIDLGNRFIALYDVPTRAQASRIPLTGSLASVITLADGKAIQQQDYFDHAEALEAVGLQE